MNLGEFNKQIGSCYVAFVPDTRRVDGDEYVLSIRYTISRKRYYHRLGEKTTLEEFEAVIGTDSNRGRMSGAKKGRKETRDRWLACFNEYVSRLGELAAATPLSLDVIKTSLTGRSATANFLTLWREVIESKKHGTAASYEIAMKSFMRLAGFNESDGFNVTKDTIHKWVQRLTDEGKAKATIGIYLRSCRVVVNECIRRGFILRANYPFSEKDADKVSIPRGKSRKQECLSVEQWTQLHDIFTNKSYPDEWTDDYKKDTHTYLGMFLFMYLANGLNMADLARLTYNKQYVLSGRKSLQFNRQKTKDRTDNDSEVIIPITSPLQAIIDALAAEYEPDGLLFPFILKDATTDKEKARRVQQENQNTKKHVRKLTAALGWTEQPSPTWCRHSFATNLQQQGVPLKYISDAMGHSTGGSVTMGYINDYPLEKQLEYNAKLLNLNDDNDDKLSSIIDNLSDQEREQLIKMLTKKV